MQKARVCGTRKYDLRINTPKIGYDQYDQKVDFEYPPPYLTMFNLDTRQSWKRSQYLKKLYS